MTNFDNSRLVVKNLPLTLDNKTLRKIFTENAAKLDLILTDCQLLHKDFKSSAKNKFAKSKKLKVFDNNKISKGVCFLGFTNQKNSKKFKDYYDGTYIRSCKISIDYAKPPSDSDISKNNRKIVKNLVRKAGVSSIRTRKIFNDEDEPPKVIEYNIDSSKDEESAKKSFNRVILHNLPYNITEDDLRALVKNFGPVSQIHIPMNKLEEFDNNKLSQQTKGFAFITFLFEVDAARFLHEKDKTIFCGRLLTILPAQPNSSHDNKKVEEKKGYKAELQKRLREDCENTDIWNTMYIDITSAIKNVSDELGISPDKLLLEQDKDSVAVTVASSETAVIARIKRWLTEEGIDLDQFQSILKKSDKNIKRSKDTILIKNLPFNTNEESLRALFLKHGAIVRFSLSPYRNMCIVKYMNAENASIAFTSLAYKNYLGIPLYLEWAPHCEENFAVPDRNVSGEDAVTDNAASGDTDISTAEDTTDTLHKSLYIKNLNFITTTEKLQDFMSNCEGLVSCKVITRYDEKKSKTLSMGFGFAEFKSKENAENAIKLMSGKLLDGYLLDFTLSQNCNKIKNQSFFAKHDTLSKPSNKLLVKNLAFQANKNELHKLFSLYGNVRNVRIPKDISKNNRGFAFVEYENKSDAKNALEILQHTHFYGRHLVLNYAHSSSASSAHPRE